MKTPDQIKILPAGKFLKLFKNDSLFATPIFRINKNRKNLRFVILFQLEGQEGFQIINRSAQGYSDKLQRLKFFTPTTLYSGMLSVPLLAQRTIQILQVPADDKMVKDSITYYSMGDIDRILYGEKAGADTYDPFRYAHSARFSADVEEADVIPKSDYLGIQDFHPFWKEGDKVLALPLSYQDPIRKIQIDLQLMGWYFLDKQLKISWKPANRPSARWRSSLLAIDKKTRRYFFQGNIYQKRGTDPVFLENLSLEKSPAAELEWAKMLNEIKKQEQLALLKLR